MFPIAEVSEPDFQVGGVVFFHTGAIRFDGGFAADGGPFAAVVEEGEVHVGGVFEVVGLAGFGVGVEDEVDAVVFLFAVSLLLPRE